MDALNEQIDLILEQSLQEEVFRELDLLLEKANPLSPREVRSVLNGLGMQKPVVLQKFKDYLKSQKSTPLGAAADAEVADKVKRLAQVFSDIWDDFYSTGTASFVETPVEEPEEREEEETGPEEEEEEEEEGPAREPTEEEKEEYKEILDAVARILAMRVMAGGETVEKISGSASILRKHFLKKKVLRRSLSEAPSAPTPSAPTPSEPKAERAAEESSTKDRDALLDAITDEIKIDLKTAKKNYAELIDSKWMTRAKEIHAASSSNDEYKKRYLGVVYLIMKQAGMEADISKLNEGKIVEIVIDFNELRKNRLDESFLTMFGSWIKHLLGAMFGDFNIPGTVRGSKKDIAAFASAIGSEKRYIDTARRYGLDHPTTYKYKSRLDTATKGFEKETGITWPFE